MLAAMALGLPLPPITMATVFIVMQPQARQVLDKSLYRLIGTVAGAGAAWAIGSLFSQTPAVFLAAIGVWVSLFTFAAAFSKQLKAYSIVLTGYTPVLIGIPAVFQLEHLGHHTTARLEEVGLGLLFSAAAILLNGARAAGGRAALPSSANPGTAAAGVSARAALLAGLHPAIAMLLMSAFWLHTSWHGGAMATLNATVDCALVALAAHPLRAAAQMSIGTLAAVAVGMLLQLCYPLLASVPPGLLLAPALAIGAIATGNPDTIGAGLGYCITLSMLAWPGTHLSGGAEQDAAGLILSIFVLTAICAILWPFRQRPQPA